MARKSSPSVCFKLNTDLLQLMSESHIINFGCVRAKCSAKCFQSHTKKHIQGFHHFRGRCIDVHSFSWRLIVTITAAFLTRTLNLNQVLTPALTPIGDSLSGPECVNSFMSPQRD